MSRSSNDNGRAYEYACLITLNEEIGKMRSVEIVRNSSYEAALRSWNNISGKLRTSLLESAKAAVFTVFDMEPMMTENSDDRLTVRIQSDDRGKQGDVRDIVVERSQMVWEIGFSVKHNHFAVKHSRLSRRLDFGQKWMGLPCSREYWNAVKPVFDYLQSEKRKNTLFRELADKDTAVYVPLLNAFVGEIKRKYEEHTDLLSRMVEYLLGMFDFYKVISLDNKKVTQIQTYNLRGTLNRGSADSKPKIIVPVASLPTRIVSLDFKPGSSNTVELYLDNGWQFSFRIHNAEEKVNTSLKFDIELIGMPANILILNCYWRG